jgi:hypothetical protein
MSLSIIRNLKNKIDISTVVFYILSFSIITFLYSNCIEPIDVDFTEGEERLIVDGMITNKPGPYEVKLSTSAIYGKSGYDGVAHPVSGAVLTISDDLGNSEVLTQKNISGYIIEGTYTTQVGGIQGVVGRTYSLHIITSDGNQYESVPQIMKAVSDIDFIDYEFGSRDIVNENNVMVSEYGFDVFVNFQDPPEHGDYYKWKWKGTYEVETQPELYVEYDRFGNAIPSPKDCCKTCWIHERQKNSLNILEDTYINGNSSRVKLIFIPYKRFYFKKYYIKIEQYSLSYEAHKFWKLIEDQLASVGGIFDPPPSEISGNILNINDNGDVVLGYFSVSAVSEKDTFITSYDINIPIADMEFHDDCRVLTGSSAIMPDYWNEYE